LRGDQKSRKTREGSADYGKGTLGFDVLVTAWASESVLELQQELLAKIAGKKGKIK